jgi:hypothetical protein
MIRIRRTSGRGAPRHTPRTGSLVTRTAEGSTGSATVGSQPGPAPWPPAPARARAAATPTSGARPFPAFAGGATVARVATGLGALLLAGEAAVHIQQYVSLFHVVRWIGPLFLANAAASLLAVAGLRSARTRDLAAVAGVAISVIALGSLVVSYGHGLFGWREGGFRTSVAIAVFTEVGAVVMLTVALAAGARSPERR